VPTTAGRAPVSDSDAEAYLVAVETADAMQLEQSVADAINSFVVGCKADGIWSAIKASCILSGARTLAGAVVPLIGQAPTSFNFVNADYSRKLGLLGNGSTKYLASNRANNADPQNSQHLAFYMAAAPSVASRRYMGADVSVAGDSTLASSFSATDLLIRSRSTSTFGSGNYAGTLPALLGKSRFASNGVSWRIGNNSGTGTTISQTPNSTIIKVFQVGTYTNPRIAFYSIGENLDLSKLNTRVKDFMTALVAAIP
jgi:hypothetical protein